MPNLKTIKLKRTSRWYTTNYYNSAQWKKLRAKKIRINPLCEICYKEGKTTEAKEIDHHYPIRFWDNLKSVLSNLTSMCKSCHSKKSRIETDCNTKEDWLAKMRVTKYWK